MEDPRTPRGASVASKHASVLAGPSQIAYDITNRCNLRCLHCYNRSGENAVVNRELSDQETLDFISDIASLRLLNLCFCGGEPLLRAKVIYEAARILSANGSMVSLVTNGLLVTETVSRSLKEAGVCSVQVSLDGCAADSHDRLRNHRGAFDAAVRALKCFSQTGFPALEVAFTPTAFNCHELPRVYELCRELGVASLRVQPLMILGRAQEDLDIAPSPLQYRQLVRDIGELKARRSIPVDWGDPIDHLIRFRTLLQSCVTFFGVRADGGIVASTYLPLLVGNVRRHKFSHYWDHGLARIWKHEKVQGLAAMVRSVPDMGTRHEGIPMVWRDQELEFDLIDDQIQL